jgi:uncharacterized RDD family membrane protein YckC
MAGLPPGINPYAPPVAGSEYQPFELPQQSFGIPADRGTRLLAHIVDNLVVGLAAAPGFIAMIGFGESFAGQSAEDVLGVFILAALFGPPLLVLVYQWYLVSTTGQSLAKRWFGIRIIKLDGSLPGFVNGVLLRSWVTYALNSVCSLVGLIDALMIFGEESRCLHDQIASTKVVKA